MIIGVLDDDTAICHVLEAVLAIAGHTVYASTDPLAFVASAQPGYVDNYECTIVDFHLQEGKSGADVIRQMRGAHPALPAILISGDPFSPTVLKELSNVALCQKPFHLSTLLELIRTMQTA
jgi:DNA-binding NtrC family response regulator